MDATLEAPPTTATWLTDEASERRSISFGVGLFALLAALWVLLGSLWVLGVAVGRPVPLEEEALPPWLHERLIEALLATSGALVFAQWTVTVYRRDGAISLGHCFVRAVVSALPSTLAGSAIDAVLLATVITLLMAMAKALTARSMARRDGDRVSDVSIALALLIAGAALVSTRYVGPAPVYYATAFAVLREADDPAIEATRVPEQHVDLGDGMLVGTLRCSCGAHANSLDARIRRLRELHAVPPAEYVFAIVPLGIALALFMLACVRRLRLERHRARLRLGHDPELMLVEGDGSETSALRPLTRADETSTWWVVRRDRGYRDAAHALARCAAPIALRTTDPRAQRDAAS